MPEEFVKYVGDPRERNSSPFNSLVQLGYVLQAGFSEETTVDDFVSAYVNVISYFYKLLFYYY